MRWRQAFAGWLLRRLQAAKKYPFTDDSGTQKDHELIGTEESPYMRRWFLIPKNRWLGVYLHHITRSDDDRAIHDHPWWSLSFILNGRYRDTHFYNSGKDETCYVSVDGFVYGSTGHKTGDLILRSGTEAHRLTIDHRSSGGVWTLFIVGPKYREWGFHCREGWVHNKEFHSRGCAPVDNAKNVH